MRPVARMPTHDELHCESFNTTCCAGFCLSVSVSLNCPHNCKTERGGGWEVCVGVAGGGRVGGRGEGCVLLLKQESVTSRPRVTLNATMFTSRKLPS